MGFFSNRYNKPGPGVGKNEPEKRRIVVFFEVYFRHFWQLEQTNLVFLLFMLPVFALLFGINLLLCKVTDNGLLINFFTFLPLALAMIPISGMTYVTRNKAREEHAFVWFDFTDQMKKNWKQSLVHGLVTYLVYFCGYYAIRFYWLQSSRSWFFVIPGALLTLLLIGFTFAQYYIMPQIVTFDLPYKNIVKNGFLFAIMAFLRNFLQTILHAVVWGLIVLYLSDAEHGGAIIGVLMLLLGFPVATSFLINFVSYPVLVKYMIKPMYGEKDKDSGYQEGDHYKPIEESDEKSEYVFENGRLVRRMDDVETLFEDRK